MVELQENLFKNKKERIYFVIGFIPVIIVILYIIISEVFYGNQKAINHILNIELDTKVEKVYIDKDNHNFEYSVFSNGLTNINYGFFVGDSIFKKKGDSLLYIFRKDTIIIQNRLEINREEGQIN